MATDNAIHSLNINNTEYEIIPKRVVTTAVESGNALPVLLGGLDDANKNLNGTVNASSGLMYAPNTGILASKVFQGNLDGKATKATQDSDGNIITKKYVTVDTEQSINGVKKFTASERTITKWADDREHQLLEGYDISCANATISSTVTCKDIKSTTTTTTTTHEFEYPEEFELMYNTTYKNTTADAVSYGKEGFGIVIKNTFCSDSPYADAMPIFNTTVNFDEYLDTLSINMDTATKIEMYNNDAVYHMFYIDYQITPSNFNSLSDNYVFLGNSAARHYYTESNFPAFLYNTYITDNKIPIFIYGKMSDIISAFNTGGSTLVNYLRNNLYTMCKKSTGIEYQLTQLCSINYSTNTVYDATVPYQLIHFASDSVAFYSLNNDTIDTVSTDTTTEEITRFNGSEGKLLFTDANNDAYIKGRNLIYTEESGVATDTNYSVLTYVAGEHSFCVGGDLSSSPIAPTEIISISSNAIVPSGTVNVGTTTNKFYQGHFSSSIYSGSSVYASYGFFESSDERLKTFVKPISVDLDKLSALKKSYFYWKDNNDRLQLGVSAQEIQKMYPELVTENEDGYLTVAYDKLSVVALAAIDKLNAKNKELEDRLLNLEDIVNKYCLN